MASVDRIYAAPLEHVGKFTFDEHVADVFEDMIGRSVPGYGSVLAMTGELAARYAQPHSLVYDLGCSLGTASLLMRTRVPAECTIIAVDTSQAMLQKLQDKLHETSGQAKPARANRQAAPIPKPQHGKAAQADIVAKLADVRDLSITNASFITLNFTLQFIPVNERRALLQSIYDGLGPGGALVLSEKIHFSDPEHNALMVELHHGFKRANGYTDLEIAQKRTALEDTLVTETLVDHVDRLTAVGFTQVAVWFQCFNFVSILAVR